MNSEARATAFIAMCIVAVVGLVGAVVLAQKKMANDRCTQLLTALCQQPQSPACQTVVEGCTEDLLPYRRH